MPPKKWQDKIGIEYLSRLIVNLNPNPKHSRQDQT